VTFDVVAFTAAYEAWLGAHIPLVPDDLRAKHEELAGPVVRFLRGTYYLWLRRVADLVPELLAAPAVPLVGDLHIENFGTWRDRHGVRRWGVNDLDELTRGAYPLDLLRLATSAALAPDAYSQTAGARRRISSSPQSSSRSSANGLAPAAHRSIAIAASTRPPFMSATPGP